MPQKRFACLIATGLILFSVSLIAIGSVFQFRLLTINNSRIVGSSRIIGAALTTTGSVCVVISTAIIIWVVFKHSTYEERVFENEIYGQQIRQLRTPTEEKQSFLSDATTFRASSLDRQTSSSVQSPGWSYLANNSKHQQFRFSPPALGAQIT